MKNLKLMILVFSISISTVSFASTTNSEDPKSETTKSELREQIVGKLGSTIDYISQDRLEAEVVFTLNNKSEIVIISVNSENEEIEMFVKSKLNYKKVKVTELNEGKIYRMPLIVINE